MDDKTILVTIMVANNEIGVIQPVPRLASSVTRRACSSTLTVRKRWARFPSP